MSGYLATIEDRGTVPGMSLGPMIGTLQGLEDSLMNLEKILTTPLPFVYSAHIRHTVWLYLFFLPFQICDDFGCKRRVCERLKPSTDLIFRLYHPWHCGGCIPLPRIHGRR